MAGKKGANRNVDWETIALEYRTGQASMCAVCKKYKVSKSGLSEYLKKRGQSKPDEHAINAIHSLNEGLIELSSVTDERLRDEVMEIIKRKNPTFALAFQKIATEVIKQTIETLNGGLNLADLKQVASIMKELNDTLQIIPKSPTITFSNFNGNVSNNVNANKLEIKFIDDGEIIDLDSDDGGDKEGDD